MEPRYDRAALARILGSLAHPGLLAAAAPDREPFTAHYRAVPLLPEPGRHLTLSQRLYLERFMRPCPAELVTSATHRLTWVDEEGITNTGHFHAGGPGPIVPIAARSAFLELWRALRTDETFLGRVRALDAPARAVLAGTTTDQEPLEIVRVGVEAAARALTQHALLAHRTRHRDPVDFARALRDSGIFGAVATRWFWELQASTHRRGMIPVAFAETGERLRYTPESVAALHAMKDATLAEARAVMHRARTEEGLGIEQAIARYHDELDLISRQYALLGPAERPVCPAAGWQRVDGVPLQLHALVADRLVEAFAAAVARIDPVPAPPAPAADAAADGLVTVPDMNCKHCVRTITAVLTSMDIAVHDIDLERKTVHAEFRSPRNRERAFEALRDSGYNPAPLTPDRAPLA
ncbi:heavy-metal-associated domain-containing protein [Nocardia sp. NPDC050697]|uniref:heavy-metal-associated domain-containing protein n=1 Tax=Nocardia sp. NPDC050697 TaxID=3155158 RepID=UPI0034116630